MITTIVIGTISQYRRIRSQEVFEESPSPPPEYMRESAIEASTHPVLSAHAGVCVDACSLVGVASLYLWMYLFGV